MVPLPNQAFAYSVGSFGFLKYASLTRSPSARNVPSGVGNGTHGSQPGSGTGRGAVIESVSTGYQQQHQPRRSPAWPAVRVAPAVRRDDRPIDRQTDRRDR